MRGKTASGFSFNIDEDARDDMELLEVISAIDKGHNELVPDALVMLLGEKQKAKLYEFCRGKSGRVSATKVFQTLKEIFQSIQEGNSDTKN